MRFWTMLRIACAAVLMVPPNVFWAAQTSHGPDLSVIILRSDEDSRPLVAPGQAFALSIGVDNLRGDADAHSSMLTVTLPPALMLTGADIAPSRTQKNSDGTALVWDLGTVKSHAFPRLLGINVATASTIKTPSELAVSAQVVSAEPDVNPDTNRGSLNIYVRPPTADLSVSSELAGLALTVGLPISFGSVVYNDGNITSQRSVLALVLPTGVSLQASEPKSSSQGNVVLWNLGDIVAGESVRIKATVSLDPALAADLHSRQQGASLKFVFDAATSSINSGSKHNHLEIQKFVEQSSFDVRVWLTDDAPEPGELPIGKDVTYSVAYGNYGNQPAPKSSVSLSLPDGLTLVSADPPSARISKTDRYPGGVASWDTGDLRVGESRLIHCKVHVASIPEDGSVVLAKISADGVDIDTRNNVAYSWRRAPRGMAKSIGTGARSTLPVSSQHSHRWIWFVVLVLIAAASWFVIRLRRSGPAQ